MKDPLTMKCEAINKKKRTAKKVQKMYARQLDIMSIEAQAERPFATSVTTKVKKKAKEMTAFLQTMTALDILMESSYSDEVISLYDLDQCIEYAFPEIKHTAIKRARKQAMEELGLSFEDKELLESIKVN